MKCEKVKTVHGKASGWKLAGDDMEMFVTELGGHHAPVTFFAGSNQPVQPYFLNPWADLTDDFKSIDLLKYIRGDFFCLPFGGNGDAVNGVQFECHGETAAGIWQEGKCEQQGEKAVFEFEYDGKALPYHVTKHFEMHAGESALYIQHTVSGLDAKMPFGHHCILRMPSGKEKSYFSCGKFDLGMTPTSLFSNPQGWEYQYLASGAEFERLEAIPTLFKEPATADYSVYPSPAGYTDLFSMFKKPSALPAWAVVVYPDNGYLFYSLKNAAVLPATTLWVANSGRYEYPWNGVTSCFAIEEGCSYFADGWKPSIEENALNRKGWKTYGEFSSKTPTVVKAIQGVARVSADFGKVQDAAFENGKITFTDVNGQKVTAAVDWNFVM